MKRISSHVTALKCSAQGKGAVHHLHYRRYVVRVQTYHLLSVAEVLQGRSWPPPPVGYHSVATSEPWQTESAGRGGSTVDPQAAPGCYIPTRGDATCHHPS